MHVLSQCGKLSTTTAHAARPFPLPLSHTAVSLDLATLTIPSLHMHSFVHELGYGSGSHTPLPLPSAVLPQTQLPGLLVMPGILIITYTLFCFYSYMPVLKSLEYSSNGKTTKVPEFHKIKVAAGKQEEKEMMHSLKKTEIFPIQFTHSRPQQLRSQQSPPGLPPTKFLTLCLRKLQLSEATNFSSMKSEQARDTI